jgi:hypothetical protein
MWSLNCLADHKCSFTNASLTPRGERTGYKFKLMNINKDINLKIILFVGSTENAKNNETMWVL